MGKEVRGLPGPVTGGTTSMWTREKFLMKFRTSFAEKDSIDDICMIDRVVFFIAGSTIKTCPIIKVRVSEEILIRWKQLQVLTVNSTANEGKRLGQAGITLIMA
jgi:hypothetical protein